jgi:hypothetical protein
MLLAILALAATPSAWTESAPRTVEWSGYSWELRRSNGLEGPGPNIFLDNRRTIWMDDTDQLHLRVWQRGEQYYAAEIVLSESLGYGTYVVETIGEIGSMDPEVILGMFTYDEDPAYAHREIDIEFGRFGDPDSPGAQFVVQPFEEAGNRLRFSVEQSGSYMTHAFAWLPEGITFVSVHGHHAGTILEGGILSVPAGNIAASWRYDAQVPPPGNERFRINLWLYEGENPERDHEVIVRSFAFLAPAR